MTTIVQVGKALNNMGASRDHWISTASSYLLELPDDVWTQNQRGDGYVLKAKVRNQMINDLESLCPKWSPATIRKEVYRVIALLNFDGWKPITVDKAARVEGSLRKTKEAEQAANRAAHKAPSAYNKVRMTINKVKKDLTPEQARKLITMLKAI